MAKLPEVHLWRDEFGALRRCEFKDGTHKMEECVTEVISRHVVTDGSTVEITFMANLVYHDADELSPS